MLKPTVAVVQGQQQESSAYVGRDVRRASEPNFNGMVNGVFSALNRQPQAQNTQPAASQPQNNMQWQHQQQQTGLGQQAGARHLSFASSMDLISPASNPHFSGNSTSQPLQSNLFRSSSHHTSHTAAAGDLLTMSRRALAPSQPQPNKSHAIAKKRSATLADANSSYISQVSFTSTNTNGVNPQIAGQIRACANPRQQFHSPQHSFSIEQLGVNPNSNSQDDFCLNNQASSAFDAAVNVSSSTVSTFADKDESHQHHRTIRRCRRSDSFEMMEDG
eukprot:CAMPEP_0172557352 /NCGR_PEP_ID=MMETSP1067-20121228/72756_1 /TAXON_ID=265564 ORGANISM="Thalassiosira punctigera, Strain Tpunct2005C2" /NCGR_SAMPLE_ID=MMETSP1067 /ASSEMBLY_ACC=CAM_ASM_000444 /LENGTH=274 /DNA_ID=CAMNT_0013346413 /DNA_START=159 /DNA_END=983 /DNA_ORIENTATION=+